MKNKERRYDNSFHASFVSWWGRGTINQTGITRNNCVIELPYAFTRNPFLLASLSKHCSITMSYLYADTLSAVVERFPSLQFLHYHWVDYVGVLRSRVLTISHAQSLENSNRLVRLTPVCSLPLHGGAAPAGFIGAAGFNALVPDWDSVIILSTTHASVMCSVSEQSVNHPEFDTSSPFQRCPRTQLQQLVRLANEELQIKLLAGVELEFYLTGLSKDKKDDEDESNLGALNDWSTASGLRTQEGGCVEACVQQLQHAGIYVEQYHMERGFRQFEISLGPLPVVRAADVCVQSQEIIKRTAVVHGYKATFFPRPFPKRSPSGLHVHLSMVETPTTATCEPPSQQSHFLAGILERLPLLCAFALGSEASYSRVEQGTIGEWVSWGTENRHTPLRQINQRHWEIRCIDSTSNIYLVMAAFIAAGIMGVKQSTKLRWGDCRNHVRNLNEQSKADLGIDTPMPKDLGSALQLLERNLTQLEELIPVELMRLYLTVKRKEQEVYANMGETQRRAAYLREY
jgi:glutamine synthetase